MDQKQTVKQILDFNKKTFDQAFNTLCVFQDETQSLMTRFIERANFIPPEGKRAFSQMTDTYRKRRQDMKAIADDHYRKASEYFVPSQEKQ